MIDLAAAFWGKAHCDPKTGKPLQLLPLSVHSLDVACVFRKLASIPKFRQALQSAIHPGDSAVLDDAQLDRLSVIALLHDMGKANLGFQDKIFDAKNPRAGHIRELAALFADPSLQAKTSEALQIDVLCNWFDPPEALDHYLVAAWSHHGSPQKFDPAETTGTTYHLARTRWWLPAGDRDPFIAIANLISVARDTFPLAFAADGRPIPQVPRLQHRFAGLLMLADWLGSHPGFFPLDRSIEEGLQDSAARAATAVRSVGIDTNHWQSVLASGALGFQDLFGFLPRALQSELQSAPLGSTDSRLVIAEAETGSGKTEAALHWFFRLFSVGAVASLYFALPTRVAARELYDRIHRYVDRAFPDPEDRPTVLLAVPRYARVDGIGLKHILPEDTTRWHDGADQAWQERTWAAEHPKRFLAAPIAVGTIDQALLSALQVRHAHLRSACLDRSLLVVDEVHASDPYMRRLLHRLLDHHLGLGGFALLLSATLGSRARAAFAGTPEPSFIEACQSPYPAVTYRSGIPAAPRATSGDLPQKAVTVQVLPYLERPNQVLPEISRAVSCGARVLVIFNTVDRAVGFHRAAESWADIGPALFQCRGVRAPHHGRFAAVDREVLDQAVTVCLGKNSSSGACVLIGTQTLEQSLDIDADLMITDLCPMDVLLQRIGRLHRHDRRRPAEYEGARCIVLSPAKANLEDWLTHQGDACNAARKLGFGSVYPDMRVLQLTLQLLTEAPCLRLPPDNRRLVEGATHAERLASLSGECWIRHGQRVDGAQMAQEVHAEYAAISDLYDKPFGTFQFHEPNAETRTRLGLTTLRVPLDRTVRSPFDQTLAEITIPGRLAPADSPAAPAKVLDVESGVMSIAYGDRRYRYSRHGLERSDEPAC